MTNSPLDALTWPRRTDRLELRRGRADDVDAVVRLHDDPDVLRWLRYPISQMRKYWLENLDTMIVAEREGNIVATARVTLTDGWAQADVADAARNSEASLGWFVDSSQHGQGVGTELGREVLAIAFDLGARRVTAGCFADNVGSWKIMEKLGMRREGHFVKESLHRDLGWIDGYEYAILREEYRPA